MCTDGIYNLTRLNTFLELKIENERLQQRLADLRVGIPQSSIVNASQSLASMYSAPSTSRGPVPSVSLRPAGDLPATCYTVHQASTPYDDLVTQANHHQPRGFTDPPSMLAYGNYAIVGQQAQQPSEDNYGDDSTRRKKVCIIMKRVHLDTYLRLICISDPQDARSRTVRLCYMWTYRFPRVA